MKSIEISAIAVGFIGSIISFVLMLPADLMGGLGPCEHAGEADSPCFCAWLTGNNVWYYCEDHKWTRDACRGDMFSCNEQSETCKDNLHTNIIVCDPEGGSTCAVMCEMLEQTCPAQTQGNCNPN